MTASPPRRVLIRVALAVGVVLLLREAAQYILPSSPRWLLLGLTLLAAVPVGFALARAASRRDRDLLQRAVLPASILASTTTVVVLFDQAGRIVYSNPAAQGFFAAGASIDGHDFHQIARGAPAEVQQAVAAAHDLLFTCHRPGQDEPETFHLAKRGYQFPELAPRPHTLVVLRPLTREIARTEVETWKKAIRVLSHELNNSLAPISSLVHSVRLMLDNPTHAQRLRAALDTIDERATHLKTFLDGYASFARLPTPSKRAVPWRDLLAGVEGLYPFRIEGPLPARPAFVDATQFQQVLINLLKNAAESGSPPDAIAISFAAGASDGVEFQIIDQGKGMAEEVRKNVLIPFFSSTKSGTGLGLALAREIVDAHGGRLSLHPGVGGGLAVRCWLPLGPPV